MSRLASMLLDGCFDGFSHGPSAIHSVSKSAFVDTIHFRPVRHSSKNATVFTNPIGPLVVLLHLHRSPANISRLVVSFVVYAIQGMFRCRLWTHVSKEPFEPADTFPLIGDCDSPSSVIGEALAVRIRTSANHRRPNSVNWSMGKSMRGNAFPMKASTRQRGLSDPVPEGGNYRPAFTASMPSMSGESRRHQLRTGISENSQSSKNFPSDVLESLVDWVGMEYKRCRRVHDRVVNALSGWFSVEPEASRDHLGDNRFVGQRLA